MSKTVATYPIVAAVAKIEDIPEIGKGRKWQTTNTTQDRFLQEFFAPCQGKVGKIPEIESIASQQAEVINRFLRERGFDISVDPFGPDEVGVASVLDVLVEWIEKGKITTIKKDGRKFQGVHLHPVGFHFQLFEIPGQENPVVKIRTKSPNNVVYMTILKDPADGFDLVAQARELTLQCASAKINHKYGGLIFPMVDLNQEVDISWLEGMNTPGQYGGPVTIIRALQQNKLRINEIGARAESAMVLVGALGDEKRPDYVIDRPFLFWIERKGLIAPLFVAYITEGDWKNPGSIR